MDLLTSYNVMQHSSLLLTTFSVLLLTTSPIFCNILIELVIFPQFYIKFVLIYLILIIIINEQQK